MATRRIITGQDVSEPNTTDIVTLQEIWDHLYTLENVPAGSGVFTALDFTGSNLTSILTRLHSDLQGIGANDHHAQVHAIGGADHSGLLLFTAIDFTASNLTSIVTRIHSDLQNLLVDGHTQYLLLAGRVGGQSAIGGTGVGDTLTLSSNTGAKTKILLGTASAYDELNARLGIGTTTPTDRIHVVSESGTGGGSFQVYSDTIFSIFDMYRAKGTLAVPANVVDTNVLARWRWSGYFNGAFRQAAQINIQVEGVPASNLVPTRMSFYTADTSVGLTEKWRIEAAGNLVPGTDNVYDIGFFGGNRPREIQFGTLCEGPLILCPIIKGSDAVSGTLTLLSTASGTKGKIILGTASAYDEVNDRIGLGILTPSYDLHISKGAGGVAIMTFMMDNASVIGLGPTYQTQFAKGSIAVPTVVASGDIAGQFQFSGRGNTGYSSLAKMSIVVDGTPIANFVPGRFEFYTATDAAVQALRWTIKSLGHLVGESGAGIVNSNTINSVTVPTGSSMRIVKRLTLAGSNRITMEGTARIVIEN